jgi:hypothetical protein
VTRTVERLLAILDRNDVLLALDRIKRRRVMRLVSGGESDPPAVVTLPVTLAILSLSRTPINTGDPGMTRTCDLRFRKPSQRTPQFPVYKKQAPPGRSRTLWHNDAYQLLWNCCNGRASLAGHASDSFCIAMNVILTPAGRDRRNRANCGENRYGSETRYGAALEKT